MFQFQKDCLEAYVKGKNGLLNAPTGMGKTFALAIPFLLELKSKNPRKGLKMIWITPLRALANDISKAIADAAEDLGLDIRVEQRTGDIGASRKKAQLTHPPDILITTPESIHLILATKSYQNFYKHLQLLVIDEWHELIGNKRGVQVELALSRLKSISGQLRVWGISATIGNLDEAAEVLLGDLDKKDAVIVKSDRKKKLQIKTLLPAKIDEYPWAGHLGIRLLSKTLPVIKENKSTLLFTNTRSQAEIWYHRLIEAYPDLAGQIALHHGSLDKKIREWVENALHEGKLKAVVCTSSLDLGVDFRPVSAVIQIGSPKGIARFVQRAGRSGHSPYETSKVYFLPTNSLEIIEASALQSAIEKAYVESRTPVIRAFDVLVQYMITLAVSDGFHPEELWAEVKRTHSFSSLSKEEWNWLLAFVYKGGDTLQAYEEFNRIENEDGIYKVKDRRIAMRHRLSMGTIVSETAMHVKMLSGRKLGTIEEYFISRLKIGDVFAYAGETYELVRVKGFSAYVQASNAKKAIIPSWMGGRISLSSEISEVLRSELDTIYSGESRNREAKKLEPLLKLQDDASLIPSAHQFLIEQYEDDEGYHLFFYPFEGRMVHEGMALLIAYRLSQLKQMTISMAMNDYGFELLSDLNFPLMDALEEDLFRTEGLLEDIGKSSNMSEMASRKFREIAAIAGLTFKGYPGKQQKERHLQSSSALFFEVFRDYDPHNLLLQQAYEEVLYNQLEASRIRTALERISNQSIELIQLHKPSPFSFPIMVDRLRDRMSNERIVERVKRMLNS
ncbi:ligase-associated DNA damage response DEXH box helicase [bacterium]|nr:ligase-associated DNA damage response DEXH box helicase [bacterium]